MGNLSVCSRATIGNLFVCSRATTGNLIAYVQQTLSWCRLWRKSWPLNWFLWSDPWREYNALWTGKVYCGYFYMPWIHFQSVKGEITRLNSRANHTAPGTERYRICACVHTLTRICLPKVNCNNKTKTNADIQFYCKVIHSHKNVLVVFFYIKRLVNLSIKNNGNHSCTVKCLMMCDTK